MKKKKEIFLSLFPEMDMMITSKHFWFYLRCIYCLGNHIYQLQALLALFTVFKETISIKLFCCSPSTIMKKKDFFFFFPMYLQRSLFKTKSVKTMYTVLCIMSHTVFLGSIWRQFSKNFKPALVSSNGKYCRNNIKPKNILEEVQGGEMCFGLPKPPAAFDGAASSCLLAARSYLIGPVGQPGHVQVNSTNLIST